MILYLHLNCKVHTNGYQLGAYRTIYNIIIYNIVVRVGPMSDQYHTFLCVSA